MKRYGASVSPRSIPAVVKKESVAPSGLRDFLKTFRLYKS